MLSLLLPRTLALLALLSLTSAVAAAADIEAAEPEEAAPPLETPVREVDRPEQPDVAKPDAAKSEAATTESEPVSTATAEQIAEWIKQLDDDKFSVRREASSALHKVGLPAIEAIAEATKSPSLEVKSRAFDLLKEFFEEGEKATQKAAADALAELSEGKGDVAARAKAILTPMEEVAQAPQQQPGAGGIQINPGGRIQIGQIQVQRQIQIGGNGMKIRIANNNGDKEIEAEENGLKVKINEDAAGKIKMEVTEKKEEKEETKKYEADSAEDLKKNEPEAYKLYDKYSQQNNIQINRAAIQIFQGGQIQPGVPNIRPRVVPAPQFAPNQQGNNLPPQIQQRQIDMLKKLKESIEARQAVAQQQQGNAAPRELEMQIKMLEQQIEKLEAQLQIIDPLPEEAPAEEAPAE